MDKGSKIFFIFLGLLMALSIGISFYRYAVLRDIVIFKDENEIPSVIDNFKEILNSWKI